MTLYQFLMAIYDEWPLSLSFRIFLAVLFIVPCILIGIVYKQVILDFLIPKLENVSKIGNMEFLLTPVEKIAEEDNIKFFQESANKKGNQNE